MKRIFTIMAFSVLLSWVPKEAKAQTLTYDATNFFQALLSYMQDGDNMVQNSTQFLQNLGLMEEQLENLKKWNERYSKISSAVYKGASVARIANQYENTYRMFSLYVTGLKKLEGSKISYWEARSAVNQGFQYLLLASREVKRAREYLDVTNSISEEKRREGLEQCDKQMSRINRTMTLHIKETYAEIDRARIINNTVASLDDSFRMRY